jgi:molecular chaperone GrpE
MWINHGIEKSEEAQLTDDSNTKTSPVSEDCNSASSADYKKFSKKELICSLVERDREMADLNVKFAKLLENTAVLKNQHVRLEADFINFRKRNQKERQALIANVREDVIINFLNVKMNLDRAFAQIKDSKDIFGLQKGLEMVDLQLTQFLESQGVREISGEGDCFDPAFQEAVNTVVNTNITEDTVLQMIEKGYMLNDRVIIPMKCIVSVPPDGTDEN